MALGHFYQGLVSTSSNSVTFKGLCGPVATVRTNRPHRSSDSDLRDRETLACMTNGYSTVIVDYVLLPIQAQNRSLPHYCRSTFKATHFQRISKTLGNPEEKLKTSHSDPDHAANDDTGVSPVSREYRSLWNLSPWRPPWMKMVDPTATTTCPCLGEGALPLVTGWDHVDVSVQQYIKVHVIFPFSY